MCAGRLFKADQRPSFGSGPKPNLVAIATSPRKGLEAFADQFFVDEGSVHLGGVEKGDAALDRLAQQRDHFVFVAGRPEAEAHAHAAEPERRNLEVAVSQLSLFHVDSWVPFPG